MMRACGVGMCGIGFDLLLVTFLCPPLFKEYDGKKGTFSNFGKVGKNFEWVRYIRYNYISTLITPNSPLGTIHVEKSLGKETALKKKGFSLYINDHTVGY